MLDRLVILSGPDKGREHHINMAEGPVVVGRSNAQATIVLPDLQASRVHFQIEERDGAKWVVDQGSSSGTIVNGRKVSAHQLKAGDILRAGETQIRFVPAGQDAAPDSQSGEQRLEDLVGTTLAHYQIKKLIARGTSGCVFQARESDSGEMVALKVLFSELSKNDEEMQRFVRAMRTIMPLRHPNLVTLSGAGRKGNHCWVAMEYIEGESLGKYIERIGKEGKLPWKFSLRVAVHIARALQYAEENDIVHRNITPNNILIRTIDKSALLGDLMLAKALEGTMAAQITKPGQMIGDVNFMSPERTKSAVDIDGRSEIFSLGATIYALLTGRPPHEGLTLVDTLQKIRHTEAQKPSVVVPQIAPEFEGVIMRMLAKDPANRYQTASELRTALEKVATAQQVAV